MQKNCYLSKANYLNMSASLGSSACACGSCDCPGNSSQNCGSQDGLALGWKVMWSVDDQTCK